MSGNEGEDCSHVSAGEPTTATTTKKGKKEGGKKKRNLDVSVNQSKATQLSLEARDFLIKSIYDRRDWIEANNQDRKAAGLARKTRAWEQVTEEFNEQYGNSLPRTKQQLITYYQGRKTLLKARQAKKNRYVNTTGGGRDSDVEEELEREEEESVLSLGDSLIISMLGKSPGWVGIVGKELESGYAARKKADVIRKVDEEREKSKSASSKSSRIMKKRRLESFPVARAFAIENKEDMMRRAKNRLSKEKTEEIVIKNGGNEGRVTKSSRDDISDCSISEISIEELPQKKQLSTAEKKNAFKRFLDESVKKRDDDNKVVNIDGGFDDYTPHTTPSTNKKFSFSEDEVEDDCVIVEKESPTKEVGTTSDTMSLKRKRDSGDEFIERKKKKKKKKSINKADIIASAFGAFAKSLEALKNVVVSSVATSSSEESDEE